MLVGGERGLAHRACRGLLCNALGAAAVLVVLASKGRGRRDPLKGIQCFLSKVVYIPIQFDLNGDKCLICCN